MKIGIDIQTTLGERTGFGYYASYLTEHLQKIRSRHCYVFFKPKAKEDFSAPRRFIWDQIILPRVALKEKVDILHQPAFSAPIFYPKKLVVTVHDVIAVLFPRDIPLGARLYFGRWMPFSYRRADKIIAVSHHTKKDLVKHLELPPQKIIVIYEAAGEKFKKLPRVQVETIKKKYQTGSNYILTVGTLSPRKNLDFLIKVFARVRAKFTNVNLLITGKWGWYYEGLFSLAKKLGIDNKVIFTGYVNDDDLPALYNGAMAFVFPSIYEGFGLPPLEAMACGTPVVASSTSCIPEIVGEGGILLPFKEKEWVSTLSRLLKSPPLREKFSRLGRKQARKFSWQETARQTIKVYESLYEETY